ncbi:MAG: hypothetical protein U0412_07645 [Nitrospira sp.]
MKKSKSKKKGPTLETQYEQFFQPLVQIYGSPSLLIEETSLEQPSPLRTVPSVVTYGAYEEPLIGA